MAMVIFLTEEAHFSALRAARQVGRPSPATSEGASAFPTDKIIEAGEEVWELCESAVMQAYTDGVESARLLIDSAVAKFNQVAHDVKDRVKELNTLLTKRINTYLYHAMDSALRSIRHSLQVGDKHVMLKSLTIDQKVKVGGALKASLTEACEFVAEGEFSISMEYAEAGGPA